MSQHIVDAEWGPESWEVSRSDRWRSRLNTPVTNVETLWERFTIGPGYVRGVRVSDPYTVDVPVAMRIDFAGGPVWMVAGLPKHQRCGKSSWEATRSWWCSPPRECGSSDSRIPSS